MRQFLRPRFDLALEAGIGVRKPAGHVVELVGERLELVAGLDRDALRQVAAADPRRTRAQRLDRHRHAARKEKGGEERQEKASGEKRAGALDRVEERRIRLVQGQLDEDVPAHRRDLGPGGEDALARGVARLAQRLLRRAA